MKKIKMLGLLIACVFVISGCSENDALKFKKEYESINDVANASGLKHRVVNIDKNNPYVYTSAEEIVKKIENKETFYLYIGDKQCPWCRSVIEKSIEIANKYNIKKIYYVNIWDDDHNEILRDKYILDDNNNLKLEIEGTEAYKKLLKYFDNVLNEYTLTTKDNKKVDTGEKRIYAPSYIYVKDGETIKLIEGTSELQKDSRENLTQEMLEEEEKAFIELFNN